MSEDGCVTTIARKLALSIQFAQMQVDGKHCCSDNTFMIFK